jgi:GT2 family glycosyltransferase/glycosyltransferase involved in cell wall biosynthesis
MKKNTVLPTCDIILPVYNSLHLVKECIESIIKYTPKNQYHLYIINDASDYTTTAYLNKKSQQEAQFQLHHNLKNLGFLQSCNLGIQQGSSDFILLINSDVIVTPHWLNTMIDCALSDDTIGSVNPLTNSAEQINLTMPAGTNFLQLNHYVQKNRPLRYSDVVTGVGFCLLLRRSIINKIGLFDEIYGQGYCEESDLCMRLTTRGYRTVVAENVYVYHKGKGSFTNNIERYQHNRIIFDQRWKKEYLRQFKIFQKQHPLQYIRRKLNLKKQWDPKPVIWQTARNMLQHWQHKHFFKLVYASVQGCYRVIHARRDKFNPQSLTQFSDNNTLQVTFVLHHLVIAGGVLSVIQIVNELILLGINARIVALFEDPIIYNWTKLYTQPIIFNHHHDLIKNFPPSDIIIATLWKTAYWVDELITKNKAKHSLYFIQDYEPWFFNKNETASRKKVQQSYSLIKHKIVKSDWLQNKLKDEGYSSKKIPLGMDLGIFYPHDSHQKKEYTIMTMARPKTVYRGFDTTILVLQQLIKYYPNINIILFGDRSLDKQAIPFHFQNEGIISNSNYLAQLYSQADIFLDASDFQGFGRCGLEAMACGTACVLTKEGGVTEYAIDQYNALLVKPKQIQQIVSAIITLLNNHPLKLHLINNGLKTAQTYCHKKEATNHLNFLQLINNLT